jgi:hypothetical protein
MNRRYNTMWKTSIMFAVMVLMLAASASAAANEVYIDPQTVYIPECGNAIVQIRMDVTDTIDTWSTKIEFDPACVNITDVDFSGGITPTNASWGHHVDHIYLGGTELDYVTGDHLLANLTVECNNSGGCASPLNTSPLNFTGEVNVTRLIAGPPDGDPPYGTIYSATWTNGTAQCVKCGDVTGNGKINRGDVTLLRNHIYNGYPIVLDWAGDVTGNCKINRGDVTLLRNHLYNGYPLNCNCSCSW